MSRHYRRVQRYTVDAMALFSRRFLQRVLNESRAYLSVKQRQDFCKLLNTVRDDYLATEWEMAILDSLWGLGSFQYEPQLEGTSHPDILFTGENSLTFLADVKSVSDRGIHQQNPFEKLQEEFFRHQKKYRVLHGGFDVRVNSHSNNYYRGSGKKPRLKLPKVADFPTKIFNADFQNFMMRVRNNADAVRQLHVEDEETSVHFSYSPSRYRLGGSSHPAFDLTAVIDQNPIYNALCAKADQLRKSGYHGLKGIFLCDAGCWGLHQPTSNWQFYGADEVVRHFLYQNQSISFVLVLIVEDKSNAFGRTSRPVITPSLHVNGSAIHQKAAIEQIAGCLMSRLPTPEETPKNAMLQLKRKDGMSGRHMGTLERGRCIEMSARMLLEILAGELSVRDFEQNHRMDAAQNPFRIMLRQGRLVEEITVEPHPEADDDRVTIRFGNSDPAIAPFRCD
jgi:hypothetical protein